MAYRMIIEVIRKIHPFWMILFLCGLNLIVMHFNILYNCKIDAPFDFAYYVDNIIGVCLDVFVLTLISFCFFYRRTKYILVICFLITWIWSFSSVIYSRFFFNYLSLSAVEQGNVLADDLIIQCIKANLHMRDLYYLCVVVLFVFFLLAMKNRPNSFSFRKIFYCVFFLIFVDISAHVVCCVSNSQLRYLSYMIHRIYNNHFVAHLNYSNPKLAHFLRGEVRTLASEFVTVISGNKVLTEEQQSEIKNSILKARNSLSVYSNDSTMQNVIFILVESYMSFTSDLRVNGMEVTPFLNSLKKDSTVYYNGNVLKNVTLGSSSDGQFIYMTGLLPLRSVITLSKARHVELPGLPKLLGRESRMIIPTVTSIWNQDEMCRQYGFDNLYSRNDFNNSILEENLTDEQVFQLAIRKDKESHIPFFSVILTISMHQPYKKQIDPTFNLNDMSFSEELSNYLNVCHYTDHQIELYFNFLKDSGLYNTSLIVIASDHPVNNTDFGNVSNNIPIYIVNAKGLPNKMWHGECNQLDVYTTLLDLLGCNSRWYGLGHSLVSSQYENSVSSQAWDVSEWILMSDFFTNTDIR